MSNLGLVLVGMCIGVGLGLLGLYLRTRRQRAFARVQGLYLESKPVYNQIAVTGSPFGAGSRSQGKDAEHVCSFAPCPHLERERARQDRHLRVTGGGE